MLLDKLHYWRLAWRSNRLIRQGITVRSEFPELVRLVEYEDHERVATAVNIGRNPALILGFRAPLLVGDKLTCDQLYPIGWVLEDHVPAYIAKKLRKVS